MSNRSHRPRLVPTLLTPALLALLAHSVAAQGFNLDCSGVVPPTPTDPYGAASGQMGHWFRVSQDTQLEGLDGNPTSVFVNMPAAQLLSFDAACTVNPDDAALMDDFHDPGNASYRFSGLDPGDYRIYTYAMAPDDATYRTDVSVPGSVDPTQTVGGDFCLGHQLGVTYALHHVTTTDGVVFVDIAVSVGFSTVEGFQIVCDACAPGPPGTPTCFGDGSANGGLACPCGNDATPASGGGCANGAPMPAGQGAVLAAGGSASISADDLVLTADFVTNQPGLFFQGENTIAGGDGVTFGDGLRCCGSNVVRLEIADPPGTNGPKTTSTTLAILGTSPSGTVQPSDKRCYQYWYRNPNRSLCGSNFNLSNAVSVVWTP